MKPTIRIAGATFICVVAVALCISAVAQQSSLRPPATYNVSREGSIIGTVLKFDAASATPPIGVHVLLQTPSGTLDVHLGNAQLLKANHMELNAGDSVRIVGENLSLGEGTFFAARIVQKGTQAIAVRGTKGSALTPASSMTPTQHETLRGVR